MKSRATALAASVLACFKASGTVFSIALFTVAATVGVSSLRLHAESAGSDFKMGQSAEAREDYDAAFNYFQKAYNKQPKDLRYRAAYYQVRVSASGLHMAKGHKLLQDGDDQGALTEFLHAAEIDPSNEAAQQEIAKVRQKRGEAVSVEAETPISEVASKMEEVDSMASPPMLKPLSNEPLTLHMTEDAKAIYQAVGKAAGVNILFDPEYQSKRIQVDLNNVTLLDALRIVGSISKSFWRPVTASTIYVAENSVSKRRDMDEEAVQTFYLSNAWQPNDLADVNNAIRGVMGTNVKTQQIAAQNAIVVRGTPDELLLVQKLIDDLDKARSEVVVDIAVLEVNKNWEQNLGISWPSSVGMSLQTNSSSTSCTPSATVTCPASGSTTSPTLYSLAHLKASDFAVSVGSATANLLLSDSNTRVLQNPRIRATDGQIAKMKIGTKIPTATGSFSSGVSGVSALAGGIQTQFQYIDVGVNIEVTPFVHYDRDVTMKVKIEVTAETGSVTISGVTEPILSQRVVEQTIRLREGEANILGGIQEKQIQESWSGIPGLSSIPLLRYLFGSKDHVIGDDELVFLVVPHVVRTQSLNSTNLRAIDTGVGQSIDLRRVPAEAPSTTPVPTHPTAPAPSNVSAIPAQSAEAAGTAALAQIHAAAESSGVAAAAAVNPEAPPPTGPGVSFMLNPPPVPISVGTSFQVPIVLMGGSDVASVPLQLRYDPARIALVSVTAGDLLSRDGQAVALVHRDDGPGSITINASRPPGAAGVNGAGVVCVLGFQAKVAGSSEIAITRPAAVNSTQQPIPAKGSKISIQVK